MAFVWPNTIHDLFFVFHTLSLYVQPGALFMDTFIYKIMRINFRINFAKKKIKLKLKSIFIFSGVSMIMALLNWKSYSDGKPPVVSSLEYGNIKYRQFIWFFETGGQCAWPVPYIFNNNKKLWDLIIAQDRWDILPSHIAPQV